MLRLFFNLCRRVGNILIKTINLLTEVIEVATKMTKVVATILGFIMAVQTAVNNGETVSFSFTAPSQTSA